MDSQKNKWVPNRSFSVLFAIFLSFIAKSFWQQNFNISILLISISLLLLLIGFTVPHVLTPVTRLWLKFGDLLHKIVSPVVLLLIYISAIIPTGLFMKVFGKDPLTKKPDDSVESYWVMRSKESQPTGETLRKQF